jgi:hypothetical protein
MAIDSDLSIANLVTEALKGVGRVNPSATQISDATAYQFRRVKSDIALKSSRHSALQKQAVTPTVVGQSRYTWPTDAHYIKSVTLLEAPTEWVGTATAGASTSITLAAGLDISDATLIQGRFLVTTGGTGSSQIRQVTGWNNTSKVATVDSAWVTNPASGTTYLIATQHQILWSMDKTSAWDTQYTPGVMGKSYAGALVGKELWLEHAPEKIYGLWWDYWAHLDRLDNTSATVLGHIREYYTLWAQGLSVWLCQRYDEDRYPTELQVYQDLLSAYQTEASHVTAMQSFDV